MCGLHSAFNIHCIHFITNKISLLSHMPQSADELHYFQYFWICKLVIKYFSMRSLLWLYRGVAYLLPLLPSLLPGLRQVAIRFMLTIINHLVVLNFASANFVRYIRHAVKSRPPPLTLCIHFIFFYLCGSNLVYSFFLTFFFSLTFFKQ